MLKRLITGIGYIAVLVGFFLLKGYVHRLWFDLLVFMFTAIGTFEMLRAFGEKIHVSQRILVSIFSPLVIPAFCLADEWIPQYAPHLTFAVFVLGLALLAGTLVFAHESVSLESTGYALLSYAYPSLFLLVLSICNHLAEFSSLSILFVFAVCPIADTLAYVFGRLFGKKLPRKMSPHVSPNKTVIGGVGGLIGGALGGVVLFFGYYGFFGTIAQNYLELPFFIALGIVTAAVAAFGDLVESAIKRKLEIKDMGRLLPGHGGILDRIDSTLYAVLVVCAVFAVRIIIA